MSDAKIIVDSNELLEYLPITQFTTSNWWSCDVDQWKGTLQINRKARKFDSVFLTLTTAFTFVLGCAMFSMITLEAEIGDVWPLGIFFVLLSFVFMFVFPMMMSYLIAQDEKLWPECRLKCTHNGEIVIFEKTFYSHDEYLELAVGVIGGCRTFGLIALSERQKNVPKSKLLFQKSFNDSYQLYLYVKKKDHVWEKYLLANEYAKRKIMSAAKMVSKHLQCKLHVRKCRYAECVEQQDRIDRNVVKAVSEQPSLYVGKVSPASGLLPPA